MPTYKVILTDKRHKRKQIERVVEAGDVHEAAAKAINESPGNTEWTARAKDNSTRPVADRRAVTP